MSADFTLKPIGDLDLDDAPAPDATVVVYTAEGVPTRTSLGMLPVSPHTTAVAEIADFTSQVDARIESAGLAAQLAPVALTGPPANLTAGVSTKLTFASAVSLLYVENNTGVDLRINFNAAATGSSTLVEDGAGVEYTFAGNLTSVHILGALASPVNGAAANNVVVTGKG
ncbi:MAG TPA: hypothetical protein VIL85_11825 [Thermomicrobiales bacterium]|jgi:hypothetical protein